MKEFVGISITVFKILIYQRMNELKLSSNVESFEKIDYHESFFKFLF